MLGNKLVIGCTEVTLIMNGRAFLVPADEVEFSLSELTLEERASLEVFQEIGKPLECQAGGVGKQYKALRNLIKEKFGTREAFSKAVNLSYQTVSSKLNNRSGFSQEDIEQWAKALGISKREYGRFFFT